MQKIRNYNEAIEQIFEFEKIKDYSLKKAKKVAKKLGNLEKKLKIIHIAGTNGKGSVSKMLFSALKISGKQVGVFTSPHLVDIRERFETNHGKISKGSFVKCLNRVLETGEDLAYFEKCFFIALLHFQEMGSEYAILEAGVGGRLDTTNIVSPCITCITSIGFDHQDLLGNTLEKIAFEKAGIIKIGVPIVVNIENDVIKKTAKDREAEHVLVKYKKTTNLLGNYQEMNAGLAYEIALSLGINRQCISQGLKNVQHNGRLQYIRKNILVDGAHNSDGLKALKCFIDASLKNTFEKVHYCFAIKKGKDLKTIPEIFGKKEKYYYINSPSLLLESYEKKITHIQGISIDTVYEMAENNQKDLYLVFGSLYMIGDFLNKN